MKIFSSVVEVASANEEVKECDGLLCAVRVHSWHVQIYGEERREGGEVKEEGSVGGGGEEEEMRRGGGGGRDGGGG